MPRLKKGESRYKGGKKTEPISKSDFYIILKRAREYTKERREKSGSEPRFKDVNVAGLLAMLYYSGLRITEIVGDVPHRYKTKSRGWKLSAKIEGITKEKVHITDKFIRISAFEVRKHGKRDTPLWIGLDRLGAKDIIKTYESISEGERLFPISRSQAWRFIKDVTGEYYPHFYRLNRATRFAEHPETSVKDLKEWFGWVDGRTIEKYMGKGGRATKDMAERL